MILIVWFIAFAFYIQAWSNIKTAPDGSIVINAMPFVGITIGAIFATVVASWILSTKEPK